MGVDHQALTSAVGPLAQPQAEPQRGILGGQEGAQVLIEGEDQLHLTCRDRPGKKQVFFISSLFYFFYFFKSRGATIPQESRVYESQIQCDILKKDRDLKKCSQLLKVTYNA